MNVCEALPRLALALPAVTLAWVVSICSPLAQDVWVSAALACLALLAWPATHGAGRIGSRARHLARPGTPSPTAGRGRPGLTVLGRLAGALTAIGALMAWLAVCAWDRGEADALAFVCVASAWCPLVCAAGLRGRLAFGANRRPGVTSQTLPDSEGQASGERGAALMGQRR